MEGNSIVLSDRHIYSKDDVDTPCQGLSGGALWTTESVPSKDTNNNFDGANRVIDGCGLVVRNGTNFRFTDLAPGGYAEMHVTSSVDYNVLITGRLLLILGDGSETLIEQPGTLVIMKGNVHAWRNPGPDWTRWMTVLVDAEPAVVKGEKLEDGWKP